MGICCGTLDYDKLERQEQLKEGNEFIHTDTFFGIKTKTHYLHLHLNQDLTSIICKEKENLNHGQSKFLKMIKLKDIETIETLDLKKMILYGTNQTILLNVEAKDQSICELWIQTIEELVMEIDSKSCHKPKEYHKVEEKTLAYWSTRQKELREREKLAQERKKQFSNVGMKYTAAAMAKRGS